MANSQILNIQEGEKNVLLLMEESDLRILELLTSWNMGYLFSKLKDCGMDIEGLKCLTEFELEKIFLARHEIGMKAKFRQKVIQWRQENRFPVVLSTLSSIDGASISSGWLKNSEFLNFTNPCPPLFRSVKPGNSLITNDFFEGKVIKDIISILNESPTNKTRELLCSKIISYCLEKNVKLNSHEMQLIANDIIQHAPKEEACYYFHGGKSNGGRLFHTYRNQLFSQRKIGMISPSPKHESSSVSFRTDFLANQINDVHLCKFQDEKNWLSKHCGPWSVVEDKWMKTSVLRLKEFSETSNTTIGNFINDWPLYKNSYGHRLVDIDFSYMFPTKTSMLLEKWDTDFIKNLMSKISSFLKYKSNVTELNKLNNSDFSEGLTNEITFMAMKLLHCILVPTDQMKKVDKNKFWKPSIIDSMDAFIVKITEPSEINKTLEYRKTKYRKYGLTLHPIIFVMEQEGQLLKSHIYFHNIFYSFDTLIQAVDINFKLFFLFSLQFPFECKKVYQFIQDFFYDIPTNEDVSNEIFVLKNELKKNFDK